ncbi:hypothetical protein SNE40_002747 [Patella caerulea]|uniref:Uncharacterized protein n=1 Tax=Patella caerulea TaxID=87958 RepID=A0AAN8Q7T5_PATCE
MFFLACKTKIKLNFTNANQLQGDTGIGMVVNNVNVYFGAAQFTGDSYLRYNIMMNNSNIILSETKHILSISFRYRETLPVDRMRVVFSTGDCGKGGRMYITHDATAIYFKVESKYGAYTNITITTNEFPPYAWKEVMFVYDGKMMLSQVRAGNLLQVSKLPGT